MAGEFIGLDSFTCQANDGLASSNAATVNITVQLGARIWKDIWERPYKNEAMSYVGIGSLQRH
jgi:hypothetical protein